MDGQRARLVSPVLDHVPTIPAQPATVRSGTRLSPQPARLGQRLLTTGWAAALGVGWPLAVVAMMALEPTPADPDAPVPLIIELALLGFLAALLTTTVAAGTRHRAAAVAGVVTGLLAATFTVSCPVSGHHEYGMWWFGELALVVGMLGVSLAALGDRARQPA